MFLLRNESKLIIEIAIRGKALQRFVSAGVECSDKRNYPKGFEWIGKFDGKVGGKIEDVIKPALLVSGIRDNEWWILQDVRVCEVPKGMICNRYLQLEFAFRKEGVKFDCGEELDSILDDVLKERFCFMRAYGSDRYGYSTAIISFVCLTNKKGVPVWDMRLNDFLRTYYLQRTTSKGRKTRKYISL